MAVNMFNTNDNISYFLLRKKIYFFINPFSKKLDPSTVFKKLLKHLPIYSFNVILSSSKKVATNTSLEIISDNMLYIVMGGDGTINSAIQYIVNTNIILAIIPTGTASDLARALNIPTNLEGALSLIRKGDVRKIDLIRNNNSYFATVGGVGLPAIVTGLVNRFKKKSGIFKFLHRHVLRGATYKIFAFPQMFLSRRNMRINVRIELDGKLYYEGPCISVLFGKQEFLGKYFQACPGVTPDDDYIGVSVLKPSGVIRSFIDVYMISTGRSHLVKNFIYTKCDSYKLITSRLVNFLADGEIIDRENEFVGRRIPRGISIIAPIKKDKINE